MVWLMGTLAHLTPTEWGSIVTAAIALVGAVYGVRQARRTAREQNQTAERQVNVQSRSVEVQAQLVEVQQSGIEVQRYEAILKDIERLERRATASDQRAQALEHRVEALEEQLHEAHSEIARLVEEKASIEAELRIVIRDRDELTATNALAKAHIEDLEVKIAGLKNEVERLGNDLDLARRKLGGSAGVGP